jgi:riboflavin kinase/FMN adenylyltransferase
MNVFYSLDSLPDFKNSVITIGSFDGVHSGHQKILQKVTELAKAQGSPSVVITFHPHPRLLLNPKDTSVQLLTSTEEKVDLLHQYGIENVVVVPFTFDFANQTPESYIEQFLIKYFKPKTIVIGYDHRFGTNRTGDISYLKKFENIHNYQVVEIEKQVIDELEVSSTKIRKALLNGDVEPANKLLGHFFSFTGEVVEGQKIGRTIGFPTANLEIKEKNKLLPPYGIYAVWVWFEGKKYEGMMYRGNRPVLKDFDNVTIEVNILDFNQNIYGKKLKVDLVKRIREDRNFDSLEDLVVQLADDERTARDLLLMLENQTYPRVGIVVLNYNTPQYLKLFLPALCHTQYGNYEIFVADNGSTDDSIKTIQEINLDGIPASLGHDKIKVIDLKKNYGFAEGYNQALKHPLLAPRSVNADKGFDYYVLLNSDCRVSPNWLQSVIESMEKDKTIAAAQPKILSYNKKRRFEYAGASGGWMDALGYPFSRGRVFEMVEKDRRQYENEAEIFWATGAAMFVKADLYHRFEGFDATHWAHMEEIDLCWRFKRAGYRVIVQPKSVVRHVGGGTMDYMNPRKSYLNFRNSLMTILKNEPRNKLFWLLPLRLILDGLAGFMYLTKGQFKHIKAILEAHFYVYGHLGEIKSKRSFYNKIIEKERIGASNNVGILRGSIVWEYYIRGRKTFKQIVMGESIKAVEEEGKEEDE